MQPETMTQPVAPAELFEVIAKIEDTMLGFESHGIFTASLLVHFGSGGHRWIGGYFLDTVLEDEAGRFVRRAGDASGSEFIMRTLQACGVERWEQVKWRTVYVLFEDRSQRKPVGIRPLPTERGKQFLFAEAFPDAR